MKAIHLAAMGLLLVACGGNPAYYEQKDKASAMADSSAVGKSNFISSSAAQVAKKDSARKFIRTADMKFKVENVIKSTYVIEDIINKHNGFVTLSNLHANVSYTNNTLVSADSSLETTHFVTENTMSLRIPNVSLDSVLKEIATQITFMDYRIIKAEDVSLQLMANKWTQKRAERHHDRLEKAIDTKAKKLRETTEAEESLASKEEIADYNVLNNISLIDRVNYSTINLRVYQRETVKNELVANEKNIRAYEPGLLSKIKDSLMDGWLFLEGFILFLCKLWPLIPIAFIIYILLKKYYGKK
ncbi:MAG TPA: DUF4349 domain-containing protein [Bacteroidia bacterium]|jgi:hypothetical protein|nr:DUF4349 domain-containing protein [Bacteroidia bacterium]